LAVAVVLTILAMTLVIWIGGAYLALPIPTLGGRRSWTDVRIQDGWRVQCNVLNGTCRLLDGHDLRYSSGDEASQLKLMEDWVKDGKISAARPHAVVLVHGLGRSHYSLRALANTFRAQNHEIIDFNYASNLGTLATHAKHLNRMLNNVQGVDRLSFVAHSMGAIVLRQAMATNEPWMERMALGRAVLLTAPNQGSAVARMLTGHVLIDHLFGPALRELADPHLGRKFPLNMTFATLTGTVNWLPFLKGGNDGLVTEEETRLDGAVQHVTLRASHVFVMMNKEAINFTRTFIAAK